MKKVLLVAVLLTSLFFPLNYAAPKADNVSLLVSGEMGREIYYPDKGPSLMAYRVKIKVKNAGIKEFVFDKMEAAFSPSRGESLIANIFMEIKKDGNKIIVPIKISAGEIKDWEFTSNGYTHDLIKNADDEPLKFILRFFSGGKLIAGPYSADLDELNSLSLLEFGNRGKKLNFTTTQ
jgi:predicted ATPase